MTVTFFYLFLLIFFLISFIIYFKIGVIQFVGAELGEKTSKQGNLQELTEKHVDSSITNESDSDSANREGMY